MFRTSNILLSTSDAYMSDNILLSIYEKDKH